MKLTKTQLYGRMLVMRLRKRLTRYQFEAKINGVWANEGRRRKNGSFTTWVNKPWKFVSDGKNTLRAKSWIEIARALELV